MRLIDQRLLGRLAQLSWFISNGEVAATRSLGFLLEHQPLRDATLGFLSKETGVDLSGVQRFVAEAVGVDFIRPDIEGLDVGGKPLLVLEAKFGALIPQSQVSGYLADQGRRLARDGQPTPGLLVLLVPESREAEARLKAETAVRDYPVGVRTLVLTWRRLLEEWEHAANALDADAGAGLASDVEQLKAMCHTLGGMVVAPLPAPDDAPWRSRYDDFVQVVTQVTASLAPSNPIGDETGGYTRRSEFGSTSGSGSAQQRGQMAIGLLSLAFSSRPLWRLAVIMRTQASRACQLTFHPFLFWYPLGVQSRPPELTDKVPSTFPSSLTSKSRSMPVTGMFWVERRTSCSGMATLRRSCGPSMVQQTGAGGRSVRTASQRADEQHGGVVRRPRWSAIPGGPLDPRETGGIGAGQSRRIGYRIRCGVRGWCASSAGGR